MSIIDLIVTGAIAAAAAAAVVRLRNGGGSCGSCENCPGSIYCKKKKD